MDVTIPNIKIPILRHLLEFMVAIVSFDLPALGLPAIVIPDFLPATSEAMLNLCTPNPIVLFAFHPPLTQQKLYVPGPVFTPAPLVMLLLVVVLLLFFLLEMNALSSL